MAHYEKAPFIYDRTTGEKIPVSKEVRDTYYGEALAVVLPEGDMILTADDGTHHTEISLPIA